MAADPPTRSWTERILEVLAELMPGRAMASAAEAADGGGTLAELTALAQGSLALWLAGPRVAPSFHHGMLFAFPEDSSGGFWMKNTILPLSIAYLAADGTTVTTTDMAPCPASASTCPTYPAGGSYRWAIEVPQGRLGDLGISDRSTITVGATSCAAPSSTSSVPTRS